MLKKCTLQEAKSAVKNLIRQHRAEGFNSGVEGLHRLVKQDDTLLQNFIPTRLTMFRAVFFVIA
jgi:hypothetical protein